MKFFGREGIAAVIGWLLLSVCCYAQVSPPSPADSPPAIGEAQLPDPIPASDFATESAEVELQLDRLENNVETDPLIPQLAAELADQADDIIELGLELEQLRSAAATPRQLDEQERRWDQQADRVEAWSERADERWKSLQQSREDLRQIRQRWEWTRDTAVDEELPVEMQQRVEQVLLRVESVQAETRQRIERAGEFIERLASVRVSINDALKQLSALSGVVNQRMRTRDSPPLWETQEADWLRIDNSTRLAISRSGAELRAFVEDQWVRLLAQVLLFLFLLWAAVEARHASQDWPDDQTELSETRRLLTHPVSLALAFAILAALPLYSALPAIVRDIFYLMLLLPVLRLAQGATNASGRIALYGLLGLSALYQIAPFSPEGSLLLRLTLLACDAFAMAMAAVLLWRERPLRAQRLHWSRVATLVSAAFAFTMFAASFVANVLGWVNLAHFLTEGVLLTLQGALFAVILVRASAALLPGVLRRGPGKSLLSVRRYPQKFERFLVGSLALGLFIFWTRQTLRRFRLRDPVAERLDEFLAAPLSWADLAVTNGDVLRALLIVCLTFAAQRLVAFFLREELFPRLRLRTSSAAILVTLLKYLLVAVGLGMAGATLGFTATQLTVLFGALGVGIGFGLQSIVNNFVSGLILMIERPIKVGDVVEMGGNWGVVSNVGVRATVVEAFEGSEIIVPNADLISREVKNWTFSTTTARIEITIGTAYDADPREVLRILLKVAADHELISSRPEPSATMIEFAPAAVKYRLTCYTGIHHRSNVASDMHVQAYEALTEAGIGNPFPERPSVETSPVGQPVLDSR